ncbi:FxsA family protein [Rhodococcus sp. BP-149]|uniref:FxsA family protein n=1 Tax=unclassified Rhodococcus (in: high G+C Gram-positive bacteria) TaxID=192944 RepID=UPI001C9B684C|nr:MULTISPECIES: FxsA family protein [unclassified Rhodococcus (in: high G+C Gram-positive bacteria)]MBY6686907.1 FxsA family protein [Rhodococcus sp. BP-288]MBY6694040.1 FxsA family protein [Rhodococcus sp. BP-188]MBY6699019.1 FxsA family protein [Rhodococcus sp. BP-285]MBY6702627.1 FxsA family protein [Rhodococcus sp. BP-283]MBY6711793.1 FxsA family protein [Rhodococcus sp. BP-160]
MPLLYFFLYLVVEISALVWLGSAIGILWTVFVVIALSALGMVAIRSQGRRVLSELRSANAGRRSPGGAVADGALVALGSVLLTIPGLVSSVLGLLLMIPLTRALLRPVIARSAARRVETAVASGRTFPPGGFGPQGFGAGHVVIDGDVMPDRGNSAPRDTRGVIDGTTGRDER